MSEEGSDFDEAADQRLVANIANLGRSSQPRKRVIVQKSSKKVSAVDLLSAIHSTRNVNEVKKKLLVKKKKEKNGGGDTLTTPLHRLASERVRSSTAYQETRNELDVWNAVVQENRKASQLSFPLEDDKLSLQSGTDRLQAFKPRTSLEIEMTKVLGTSKNNLSNEEVYTEAEKEIIKAMSLSEAKAKCAQLRKMRAVIGYREAKLKRQAKIKSKSYHRHLKKQKRKQLIKEFDELLVKNPEAAKEKFAEIDRQRILERATLKHRNGSKRMQLLARHAARDPVAKKALEEQIRTGRDLVEKRSSGDHDSADSHSDDDEEHLQPQQLLAKAAEIAAREDSLEFSSPNPKLKSDLQKIRAEQKAACEKSAVAATADGSEGKTRSRIRKDRASKTPIEVEEVALHSEVSASNSFPEATLTEEKSRPPKAKKAKVKLESAKRTKKSKSRQNVAENSTFSNKKARLAAVDNDDGLTTSGEAVRIETDISLDPRNFLHAETSALTQVNADFNDKVAEFDDLAERDDVFAETFEDPDAIEDFEAEKEATEMREEPKDIDLTLQGWGTWASPNTSAAVNSRFVIKAKKKLRRDRSRQGVIISEAVNKSIENLQPRCVPFPYTTVEDYETVLRQPIGKEWNTPSMSALLTQRLVTSKAGRIIESMKKDALKEKMAGIVSGEAE